MKRMTIKDVKSKDVKVLFIRLVQEETKALLEENPSLMTELLVKRVIGVPFREASKDIFKEVKERVLRRLSGYSGACSAQRKRN